MTDAKTYDVVVIGSGPGGYVAAVRAAQLNLKTCCIEKSSVGGTCLNVGCIPSKTLLHSSEEYFKMKHHSLDLGIECNDISFSFAKMMENKAKTIASLQGGIQALFKKNKITSIEGKASFISPHEVEVLHADGSKEIIRASNFILATGSTSSPLPFAAFDEKLILSSTGALQLEKVPKSLIVIGAGVIGCELGSVYSRLGSEVIFIEFLDRICPTLDSSLSAGLQKILEKQNMSFLLSTKVTAISKKEEGVVVSVTNNQGKSEDLIADVALLAVGRKPNTEGLNLSQIGIITNPRGDVLIDGCFRTSHKHIYAIGDLIDGPMLAHKASEEGITVAEIIAGKSPIIDYMSIPNVVYTYPEVASTGMTEEEVKALGREYSVGQFSFSSCPRAKCNRETDGFVKILKDIKSGKLLGAHILGKAAGEMIAECSVAIKNRLKVEELAEVCHAHPSFSESIKEACLAACQRAIHK